jgi:hypothetical protein
MSSPVARYCSWIGDHVGSGYLQQVVVALQALGMVLEALAAVVGLGQSMALDHRAHRAVEDDDPFLQDLRQGRGAGVGRCVHGLDCRKRFAPAPLRGRHRGRW